MPVTLNPLTPTRGPARPARIAAQVHRSSASNQLLVCVAGSFATESEAAATAGAVAAIHGLEQAHWSLASPADSAVSRWLHKVRRWTRRPNAASLGFDDLGLVALLGATLAAVAMAGWLFYFEAFLGGEWFGAVAAAAPAGAAAGVVVLVLGRRRLHYRRFDRSVAGQLAAGRWVLLVHDIPEQRQEEVMALVCGRSIRWCAVYLPQRSL